MIYSITLTQNEKNSDKINGIPWVGVNRQIQRDSKDEKLLLSHIGVIKFPYRLLQSVFTHVETSRCIRLQGCETKWSHTSINQMLE